MPVSSSLPKTRPTVPPPRSFRIRPAYFVVVALMAFFAYKFVERTQQVQQLSRQAAVLRAENQKTQAENDWLQRRIAYERTLPFVQDEARAILGYTMPGEFAVQSQPIAPGVVGVRAAPPPVPSPPQPTWKLWWQSFFG